MSARLRVGKFFKDTAILEVRVSIGIGGISNRRRCHALILQGIHDGIVVMLNRPRLNQLIKLILVLVSAQCGGKLLILSPFWVTQGTAETLPLMVIAHSDTHPAVFSPTAIVTTGGGPVDITVADAALYSTVHGVVHDRLSHLGNERFDLGSFNELPPTCPTAVAQGDGGRQSTASTHRGIALKYRRGGDRHRVQAGIAPK